MYQIRHQSSSLVPLEQQNFNNKIKTEIEKRGKYGKKRTQLHSYKISKEM